MCADDICDVWRETTRQARKKHRCHACHEQIAPGSEYVVIGSLFDGRWDTCKQCVRCNSLMHGIARHTMEPVVATLDCGADPLEPGEAPHLDALAFWLPGEPVEC